eukprot:Ihof_evm2s557 gene=Ihof_evmTU2s557
MSQATNKTMKKATISVTLNLEGHSIKLSTVDEVAEIVDLINVNKKLTHIKLSNTRCLLYLFIVVGVGVEAANAIAVAMNEQKSLESADLSDMFTGRLLTEIPQAVKTFGRVLSCMQTLRVINFSDNAFGPAGAEAVSELISTNYNIKTIKLVNNGLGIRGGQIIAESIRKATAAAKAVNRKYELEVFHAGRNRLENVGAQALAVAISEVGTLKEFHVPQNGIRKEGIISICSALHNNLLLESLDLNDNTCTRTGAVALASLLPSLPHLRHLDLGDCLIRARGGVIVVDALCRPNSPTGLQYVNLAYNEIRPTINPGLGRLVHHNRTIKNLDINGNFLTKNDVKDLRAILGGYENVLGAVDVDSDEEFDDDSEDESESEEESEDQSESEEESKQKEHPSPTVFPGIPASPVGVIFAPCTTKKDTASHVEDLVDQIKDEKKLVSVKMSKNSFGMDACMALAEALKEHPELEHADLSDIFTGRLLNEIPQSVTAFGDAFMGMRNLRVIDFSDNAFSPAGAEAISPLLTSNYHIKILRFINNGLGIGGGKIIAKALLTAYHKAQSEGQRYELEGFHAGRNRLETEGATALAEAFKTIGTLKAIQMPQNGIRSAGIKALAAAVSANTQLTFLDLNDNTFNDDGAICMASALSKCQSLSTLDFGDCLMGEDGSAAVCEALTPGHTLLQVINIAGNDIERDGKKPILNMLQNKTGLLSLDLSNNDLGKRGVSEIT